MSLIEAIVGSVLAPPVAPTPTPTPTPSPWPTPTPTASPTPTPPSAATTHSRRSRAKAQAETPQRRWGEAGSLTISEAAVRAERRMRIAAAKPSEPDAPAKAKTSTGTAADVLRNAAQSLIAQANVERQGAVNLLLK